MSITLQHERDNIYRVEVGGTLRQPDFEECQDQLAGEMSRIGPVKLLFVLNAFDGWDRDGNWSNLSFFVRHGDRVERIAIVGPVRWQSEALMFAGADLRRGPVEFFREDALADARAWLSS